MNRQLRDEQQTLSDPSGRELRVVADVTETVVAPLPPAITEHPSWRAIWRKLLAPIDTDAVREDGVA